MLVFFFNDTATTEIYTLSLHDALPICARAGRVPAGARAAAAAQLRDLPGGRRRFGGRARAARGGVAAALRDRRAAPAAGPRSEEHTSELQSRQYLVCRLLLEKKQKLV